MKSSKMFLMLMLVSGITLSASEYSYDGNFNTVLKSVSTTQTWGQYAASFVPNRPSFSMPAMPKVNMPSMPKMSIPATPECVTNGYNTVAGQLSTAGKKISEFGTSASESIKSGADKTATFIGENGGNVVASKITEASALTLNGLKSGYTGSVEAISNNPKTTVVVVTGTAAFVAASYYAYGYFYNNSDKENSVD